MPLPRPTRRPAALLLVLALVACGGGDAEGRAVETPVAGAAAASADPPAAARAGADSVEVTLDGRVFAGTHRAAGSLGCTMYGGLWQASYEDQGAAGLSALIVQLKEIPAGGGSTDRVTLSLVFGQMDDASGTAGVVDVAGAEFGGDARGTVTRDGDGAVLRVEGTARHGARVTAVLRCASVELLR